MSSNLKIVIESVSEDKNLDQAVIVNEEADEIELFQFRTVVDAIENVDTEILPDEAKKHDPDSVVGDALGFKIDTSKFGRISAQTAKQIIVQKVRDAERQQIFDEYKDRVGEVVSGYVRRVERGNLIVELGKYEAIVPYREQIPGERYRAKDRIQGYLMDVKRASRGPQIVLSRAHPGFLISLFEQNVTEIYDGIVQIMAAARDPGQRAKVAVTSRDPSVVIGNW